MTIRRRHALALTAAGLLPMGAGAQSARKWAVMSLIGRELTQVTYQPSVGSRSNNNRRDVRKMPAQVLDLPAMKYLGDLIKARDPAAVVGTIDGSDAEYAAQDGLVASGRFQPAADLAADLKREGFTHFVLLTRLRADAALKTGFSYEGSGRLEGAGFYIDTLMPIQNLSTGIESQGFLAPYVYFKLHLIELTGMSVLGEQEYLASDIVTNEKGERGFHPANALTPNQRIEVLRALVRDELGAALPPLLQRLRD